MNGHFADAHDFRKRYPQSVVMTSGWGVGGAVKSQIARGAQLQIGNLIFDQLPVEVSLNKKGASADPHEAGNIGAGLLKRYTVTFDYPGKRSGFSKIARAVCMTGTRRLLMSLSDRNHDGWCWALLPAVVDAKCLSKFQVE
jgi:hypothetical protein